MQVQLNITHAKTEGQEAPPVVEAGRLPRFNLFTVSDVLALPDPEWLIESMVEVGAQGVLYGPSGHGKTFVALDWALCIATGRSWQGQKVKTGPVLYVVSEGGRGIKKRVAAWMQENGVAQIGDAFFVLEAVQLRTRQDYDLIIQRVDERKLRPALIVFDTFARCFVGGDENTSKDVGEFVDATRRLHEHTAASVLIVHHTGRAGDKERGSTALRAAADVMFKVSKNKDGVIVIENDKQKDAEEFPKINLRLKGVEVRRNSDPPTVLRSAVLFKLASGEAGQGDNRPFLNERELFALSVLRRLGPTTSGGWHGAICLLKPGVDIPKRTFNNWRSALLKKALVERLEGTYWLTVAGAAVANGTPLDTEKKFPIESASHATTPEGVARRREGGGDDTAFEESIGPMNEMPYEELAELMAAVGIDKGGL